MDTDYPSGFSPYRKLSSGDLQSRLKTRKLLGVGETDDGDVYRSKLSQVLGHNEQLYTRLPKGLSEWLYAVSFIFTIMAFWALILPGQMFDMPSMSVQAEQNLYVISRLYGAVLLSFSVILWSISFCTDKAIVKWTLLATALYFIIQIIVMTVSRWQEGLSFRWNWHFLFLGRLAFILINTFFYLSVTDRISSIHRYLTQWNIEKSTGQSGLSLTEIQDGACPSFFPNKNASDKKIE